MFAPDPEFWIWQDGDPQMLDTAGSGPDPETLDLTGHIDYLALHYRTYFKRGAGYCFWAISVFLCQPHYEKTAGPICMKFSGKLWSDHGMT